MLAAVYDRSGDSSVLHVREIVTPAPGAGEVRVKVGVSGVNPSDWKARRGSALATAAMATSEFQIPNQDGAGTIDAVGAGVDEGRIGERVWLVLARQHRPWGTAAEYTVIPAERAVPLPDSASFELGASLGVPAVTAAYCLQAVGPVAGLTVLVSGGAGAVGHAAIELARHGGAAHVVATVSGEEKAELARAAGAHTVVNYRHPDVGDQIRAAAPDGIDRFVEVAVNQNIQLDLAVAANQAVITSYAANDADIPASPRQLMARNLTLRFFFLYGVSPAQLQAAIKNTSDALAAGALTTLPIHRYKLEEIAQAHDAVEQGAVGKVVIDLC